MHSGQTESPRIAATGREHNNQDAGDVVLAIWEYLRTAPTDIYESPGAKRVRELIQISDLGGQRLWTPGVWQLGQRTLRVLEGRLASPSGQGTS